jgi:hypothetical protein
VLTDQSWTDLLGELLNPDFNDAGDHFASNNAGADSSWFRFAQEGIESWAAHDLPSPSDVPSQPEPTPTVTTAPEPIVNDSVEYVCYGMVCLPPIPLLHEGISILLVPLTTRV